MINACSRRRESFRKRKDAVREARIDDLEKDEGTQTVFSYAATLASQTVFRRDTEGHVGIPEARKKKMLLPRTTRAERCLRRGAEDVALVRPQARTGCRDHRKGTSRQTVASFKFEKKKLAGARSRLYRSCIKAVCSPDASALSKLNSWRLPKLNKIK